MARREELNGSSHQTARALRSSRTAIPRGVLFPDFIDKYLSLLAVADFQSTSDPNAVLYTGTVFFPSSPGSPPVLQHRDPSGAVLDFPNDLTLQFRLLIPRSG